MKKKKTRSDWPDEYAISAALRSLEAAIPKPKGNRADHDFLFKYRYPPLGKPACPGCGAKHLSAHMKGRQCWRCDGLVISPTAGTYLEKVRAFSGWEILALAYLYAKYGEDISYLEIKKRLAAGTYNSIDMMFQRFKAVVNIRSLVGLSNIKKAEAILQTCLTTSK